MSTYSLDERSSSRARALSAPARMRDPLKASQTRWLSLASAALILATLSIFVVLRGTPDGMFGEPDCAYSRLARMITSKSDFTYIHVAIIVALASAFFVNKGTFVRNVELYLLPALAAHTVALSAASATGQCPVAFVVPAASVITQACLVMAMCHADSGSLLSLLQLASAMHICLFPAASVASTTSPCTSCGTTFGAVPAEAASAAPAAGISFQLPGFSPDATLAAALMALLMFAGHGVAYMRDFAGAAVILKFMLWVRSAHCCPVVTVTAQVAAASLSLVLGVQAFRAAAAVLNTYLAARAAAAAAAAQAAQTHAATGLTVIVEAPSGASEEDDDEEAAGNGGEEPAVISATAAPIAVAASALLCSLTSSVVVTSLLDVFAPTPSSAASRSSPFVRFVRVLGAHLRAWAHVASVRARRLYALAAAPHKSSSFGGNGVFGSLASALGFSHPSSSPAGCVDVPAAAALALVMQQQGPGRLPLTPGAAGVLASHSSSSLLEQQQRPQLLLRPATMPAALPPLDASARHHRRAATTWGPTSSSFSASASSLPASASAGSSSGGGAGRRFGDESHCFSDDSSRCPSVAAGSTQQALFRPSQLSSESEEEAAALFPASMATTLQLQGRRGDPLCLTLLPAQATSSASAHGAAALLAQRGLRSVVVL